MKTRRSSWCLLLHENYKAGILITPRSESRLSRVQRRACKCQCTQFDSYFQSKACQVHLKPFLTHFPLPTMDLSTETSSSWNADFGSLGEPGQLKAKPVFDIFPIFRGTYSSVELHTNTPAKGRWSVTMYE